VKNCRISTRTKIAAGFGLILSAAAVALFTGSPSHKPQVTMSVASHTSNSITLSFTNCGRVPVECRFLLLGAYYGKGPPVWVPTFTLAARSSTQVLAVVSRPEESRKLCMACTPIHGLIHNLTDDLRRKLGFEFVTEGFFVVSVDLPPPEP